MKFTIFIFIFKIISIILLPSDELWNQTLQYIDEGLIYNFNKKHFIFEEENFTALDIDDEKMKDLYNKQEKIYRKYGISTYIFAVSNINENIEKIGSIRNNTRDNLKKYGYDVDNSVFTVFSIEPIKGLIYTGINTKDKYISDDNAKYMKEKIINNLENESYYNAWDDFLDDIIYFCNRTDDKTSKSDEDKYTRYIGNISHSDNETGRIVGLIVGVVAVIGMIISVICCCKKGKCKNTYNNDNNSSYNGGAFNIYNNQGNNYGVNNDYSTGNNNSSIGGNSSYNGGNNNNEINIKCSGGA